MQLSIFKKKDKYKTTVVFSNGEKMHLPFNFHDISNMTKTKNKWIVVGDYMFNADNIAYVHCEMENKDG